MNDPLEALRSLTSHSAAVANEQTRNRPRDRSPIQAFEGDIPADGISATEITNNFGSKPALRIVVKNAKVTRASSPTDATTFEILIPTPKDANFNSELGQMTASANAVNETIDSILDLRGRRITAGEDVFTFMGRENTHTINPDTQKEIWVDKPIHVYYFRITRIQGAGMAAAPTKVPTEDDLKLARKYVESLQEANALDGLNNVTSVLKDLQTAGINFDDQHGNQAMSSAVVARKLPEYLGMEIKAGVA